MKHTCVLSDDKPFPSACRESERRNWEVYEESCWKIRNVL